METAYLSETDLEETNHPDAVVEIEDTPANHDQQQAVEVEQGRGDISLDT